MDMLELSITKNSLNQFCRIVILIYVQIHIQIQTNQIWYSSDEDAKRSIHYINDSLSNFAGYLSRDASMIWIIQDFQYSSKFHWRSTIASPCYMSMLETCLDRDTLWTLGHLYNPFCTRIDFTRLYWRHLFQTSLLFEVCWQFYSYEGTMNWVLQWIFLFSVWNNEHCLIVTFWLWNSFFFGSSSWSML